ncbi:MAG: replicative DNA helicase, partial [Planctomycetota bacterium]
MAPERQSTTVESADGRTPPHNAEAERGLLGSLLLSCSDTAAILENLLPEHFFNRRHQVLYEHIRGIYDRDGGIDMILLRDSLARENLLEEIGGTDYLLVLTESVQTSANAEHYAEIVRDRALRRALIATCTEVIQSAYEDSADAGEQLDRAEQRIFEVSEQVQSEEIVPLRDAIKSTFDLLDQWAKGNTGMPTGFVDLDKKINGLQPSELIVVAGRPSMGKTTLSLNIARNVALQSKGSVLVFSLEVDRTQMAINLLCSTARVSASKVRSMDLPPRDWQKLTTGADRLSEAKVFIDDSAGLNSMSIRAKARRMKAKYDISLVVIDYLQLLEHGGRRHESRQQEISTISRSLKLMAKELKVPVITISQLSRAVEQREDHRPRMSDLRESGAIEQDADLVLLLYREEYYKPEKEEAKGKAEVIIAKHRNGPVGTIPLAFFGEFMAFDNLAFQQDEF